MAKSNDTRVQKPAPKPPADVPRPDNHSFLVYRKPIEAPPPPPKKKQ